VFVAVAAGGAHAGAALSLPNGRRGRRSRRWSRRRRR
jgi:hypothetical protein